MLEFACGVSLGVDIADFLELQGAFERNRIMNAAPEEERMLLRREALRPSDHLRLKRKHGLQCRRNVAQPAQRLFFGFGPKTPLRLCERERKEIERRELRCKSLRGGDADFNARTRDVVQARFVHHGRGCDVADRKRILHAELVAGMAQRCKRIGRFARLRNRHDERVGVGHGDAVAIFACYFHVAGNPRNCFDPVFGGEPRVVGGAASKEEQALRLLEDRLRIGAEKRRRNARKPLKRVADRARLLEDFLLHIVAVRSKVDRARIGVHDLFLALDGRKTVSRASKDAAAFGLDFANVAFFEVDDAVGDARDGHRVGSSKHFLLAHADHEGRALPCDDDAVGLVAADNGNAVAAFELHDGLFHRFKKIAFVAVVNEMRKHLSICLTRKFKPFAQGELESTQSSR